MVAQAEKDSQSRTPTFDRTVLACVLSAVAVADVRLGAPDVTNLAKRMEQMALSIDLVAAVRRAMRLRGARETAGADGASRAARKAAPPTAPVEPLTPPPKWSRSEDGRSSATSEEVFEER
jgi:hypothetical protein